MSEERKKAGVWPWIVALLIGMPVLYVLSWAPAEVLATNLGAPEWLFVLGKAFYAPLAWLQYHIPELVNEWHQAYGEWWDSFLDEP